MKRNILFWALAFVSLAIGAVAPDPALMQYLQEQGDTAGYNRMLRNHQALMNKQAAAAPRRATSATQALEKNLAPHGLVVLVSFTDTIFRTPVSEIDSMLNGQNYTRAYSYKDANRYNINVKVQSEGSARQYFIDQSMGQYQPVFDVVGPVQISHNMAYYGKNNSMGNDTHADDMIIEACRKADTLGVDFSQYDNNHDGMIDFVYVIYAGYGEADSGISDAVWPHTYWIKEGCFRNVLLDGKYLNTYACGGELSFSSKKHVGIGTFCHEFSHVLGLPDLYPTNSLDHKTQGNWDLMCSGNYLNDSNTPPAYSSYERFFLGWLTPVVLNEACSVRMWDLKSSNTAYMITSSGTSNLQGTNPSPTEFFMLENRVKTGWDKKIPGEGMLITHVRFSETKWFNNTVNNSASQQCIDLVEADGVAKDGSSGKKTDAFPAGATEYTMFTNYPITNIAYTNNIITFDLMGGGKQVALDEVKAEGRGAVKFFRDGQLLIIRDGKVFDTTGRLIE